MTEIFSAADVLNLVVLFLLVVTAVATLMANNLMVSVILLTSFSLLMALEYLVLGAPDVAITEAAVGAGVSTVLMVLSLFLVGENEKKSRGNNFVPVVVVLTTLVALIYATMALPHFGDANNPTNQHVVPYYLSNSAAETGIPNVVTSILASYRGYDTFGEVTVILTAGVSVLMLLLKTKKKKNSKGRG